MPEPQRLHVAVVYAEPGRGFRADFEVPAGATVADAIAASGIRERHPDLEIRADRVGIFARRVTLDTPLRAGDRVEIYRPLRRDPKEARRRRANESGC